jgi:O-antigen ligase
LYGRARLFAVGLEEFTKAPIFGNGLHRDVASFKGREVIWHNFHVEWLEYGGLIGYTLYVGLLVLHFRGVSRAARFHRALAVNLTVVFTILVNGLTNSFTAGISPVLGFLFMGLNRAFLNFESVQRAGRN